MKNPHNVGYQLFCLAIVFAALSIFFQMLPLNTADHFQESLGIPINQVINLTSLYFITYAIMQVPGGILLDKFGLKYVLPFAIFITTIGC